MVQATAARCADCIFTAQIILCCSWGWKWNEAVSKREGVKFNNRSVRSLREMHSAVWTVPALSCLDLPQKCTCVGDPITEHVLLEPLDPLVGKQTEWFLLDTRNSCVSGPPICLLHLRNLMLVSTLQWTVSLPCQTWSAFYSLKLSPWLWQPPKVSKNLCWRRMHTLVL